MRSIAPRCAGWLPNSGLGTRGSVSFRKKGNTKGVDRLKVPLGARFRPGNAVLVEITQIGKECYRKCAILYQAGDCIMSREGILARALEGVTSTAVI